MCNPQIRSQRLVTHRSEDTVWNLQVGDGDLDVSVTFITKNNLEKQH